MTNDLVDNFDNRIVRIEAVASAVAKFQNPELQVAAFRYLLGASGGNAETLTDGASFTSQEGAETEGSADSGPTSGLNEAPQQTRKRQTSKAAVRKKQTLTFDKSLDFYSSSGELGTSLKDFVDAHPARNTEHKSVLVVYWLSKELGLAEINVDHVYSAFKTLEWPIPSSLLNTLQKAGSRNFLNTKKSSDIKITTHGENLVEFQLLPKSVES